MHAYILALYLKTQKNIEEFYGELNRIMKITEKRINKHKDMLTGIVQSSLYFDKNINHQV